MTPGPFEEFMGFMVAAHMDEHEKARHQRPRNRQPFPWWLIVAALVALSALWR